jgi:hypothetical protein
MSGTEHFANLEAHWLNYALPRPDVADGLARGDSTGTKSANALGSFIYVKP